MAPEAPRTPQQYGTEGLKGALNCVPTTPRGLRLSDRHASIIDTNWILSIRHARIVYSTRCQLELHSHKFFPDYFPIQKRIQSCSYSFPFDYDTNGIIQIILLYKTTGKLSLRDRIPFSSRSVHNNQNATISAQYLSEVGAVSASVTTV